MKELNQSMCVFYKTDYVFGLFVSFLVEGHYTPDQLVAIMHNFAVCQLPIKHYQAEVNKL